MCRIFGLILHLVFCRIQDMANLKSGYKKGRISGIICSFWRIVRITPTSAPAWDRTGAALARDILEMWDRRLGIDWTRKTDNRHEADMQHIGNVRQTADMRLEEDVRQIIERKTRDIRQDMWNRQEKWDMRQEMWDSRCETGYRSCETWDMR